MFRFKISKKLIFPANQKYSMEVYNYMSLNIQISYDQEFVDLINSLKQKYPQELFDLDGIGKQLDIHQFSKEFFNAAKTAADCSVDSNSNVSGRDSIIYIHEVPKPIMKLNSYFNIWKQLKKEYGLETANKILEHQITGDIYINDAWNVLMPYCFNYSTYDIALEGLKMDDRLVIDPPKALHSFIRQVEQFTVYAANSTLGATGLADVLIVASWYVDRILETGKDHKIPLKKQDAWDYVREQLMSFIYTVNWRFRSAQSPFTNISIYDANFLRELVPSYVINDATPRYSTIKKVQELFLDCMNEVIERTAVTFPVVTACFSVGHGNSVRDQDFLRMIAEKNLKFGFINMYCGKTATLSSCCFSGNQEVSVTTDKFSGSFSFQEIDELLKKYNIDKLWVRNDKSEWKECEFLKVPYQLSYLYRIELTNGCILECTPDHIWPTWTGDKETKDLTENDYIASAYFTEVDYENKDLFRVNLDSNQMYIKIKSIDKYKYTEKFVYCLKMKDESYPYFVLSNGIVTHNCRLRSDMENLGYQNAFGAGATKIGSLGVVTVNLPRIAYTSSTVNEFIKKLKYYVNVCSKINYAKRQLIKKRIELGSLPLYSLGYMSLSRQYSTVGITGLYEAVKELGADITSKTGQDLVLKILNTINRENDKLQKELKIPHNVEQVPAENSAIKLAKKDKLMGYKVDCYFYSNQFIPLITGADLLDRIYLQGLFDEHFSGGAILHLNVAEQIDDVDDMVALIETACNQGVVYFAINYVLNKCQNNHITVGNTDICSICGEKIVDKLLRVVGFITSVSSWARERREHDFPNRQFYNSIKVPKGE